LETPVFDPKTLINRVFDPKTGFFDSKTGNNFRTYFQTIVWKDRIFPKNFWTSKTELFRNSPKQKVWKIPSFAGPYLDNIFEQKIYRYSKFRGLGRFFICHLWFLRLILVTWTVRTPPDLYKIVNIPKTASYITRNIRLIQNYKFA